MWPIDLGCMIFATCMIDPVAPEEGRKKENKQTPVVHRHENIKSPGSKGDHPSHMVGCTTMKLKLNLPCHLGVTPMTDFTLVSKQHYPHEPRLL